MIAVKNEGIYAKDFNGVRCWINQDEGTESDKSYGEIDGQYSHRPGGQLDMYQQSLAKFQEGKRDEAVSLLKSKFAVVTANFDK